jgi:hypothetical protein
VFPDPGSPRVIARLTAAGRGTASGRCGSLTHRLRCRHQVEKDASAMLHCDVELRVRVTLM